MKPHDKWGSQEIAMDRRECGTGVTLIPARDYEQIDFERGTLRRIHDPEPRRAPPGSILLKALFVVVALYAVGIAWSIWAWVL